MKSKLNKGVFTYALLDMDDLKEFFCEEKDTGTGEKNEQSLKENTEIKMCLFLNNKKETIKLIRNLFLYYILSI